MKIILGSASPRRKNILRNIINEFEIIIPSINENTNPGERPYNFCERISAEKAAEVIKYIPDYADSLIISCDTIVTIDNQIIGKPADFTDAVKKIRMLNGKTHKVISSITLLYKKEDQISQLTRSETTNVIFKNISEEEIIEYLNNIDYKDKAGAYAIQDDKVIIESIKGSITNVIGFPLRLFFKMLACMDLLNIIFLNTK